MQALTHPLVVSPHPAIQFTLLSLLGPTSLFASRPKPWLVREHLLDLEEIADQGDDDSVLSHIPEVVIQCQRRGVLNDPLEVEGPYRLFASFGIEGQ